MGEYCATTKTQLEDGFPSELKKTRILLATESLGPVNGVSRTTLMLINYLREHDVEVAIVAPDFQGKIIDKANTQADVRLHGYPLPYNPDLMVAYPFRYDRVCLRTFKPDIVYLASPASVGFQFLIQIRQLQEPPVVLLNFQTDLAAYSEIMFPRFMNKYAAWLLGTVQGFLFNHRAVHTIFYPSRGIRTYLEKHGAPSHKLAHLGRGVDTSLFHPSCRDAAYHKRLAPKGEIVLVSVCRLGQEKGFEFLAHAAKLLVQEGLPFKLLIVGGNKNPKVEDEIRQLFDGVKENVVFAGFQIGKDLARQYSSGDVFLHCSITETFGLVVLEAMASGLPVIARDQGGPSEIVRDQETGYLVPPDDLKTFVDKIRILSKDKRLRETLASTARQVAEDTTWERINQRVASHLVEGLQKRAQQIQAKTDQQYLRNWLINAYHDLKSKTIVPMIVALRVNAAILVVFVMWIIAVLPLIVHGNSTISAALKKLFSSITGFSGRKTIS